MNISGSYDFDAPQQIVWESLQDPNVLATVLPGCEKLEQVGENQYKGKLKIKIGPVQGKYTGKVTLEDINAPDSYVMRVDGKGSAGFVNGNGNVNLSHADGVTTMAYDGKANVGGRLASVGQRVMDSSAKAVIKQALAGLDQHIQQRVAAENGEVVVEEVEEVVAVSAESPPPTPSQMADAATAEETPVAAAAPVTPPKTSTPPPAYQAPEPPSQTAFALGVAKEVLNDFLDEDQQVFAAAGLITALILLFWRRMSNQITKRTAAKVIETLRDEGVIRSG